MNYYTGLEHRNEVGGFFYQIPERVATALTGPAVDAAEIRRHPRTATLPLTTALPPFRTDVDHHPAPMPQDTTHDDTPPIETLTDPETLRDLPAVEYLTETKTFPSDEFDQLREDLAVDGWIVVGLENDAGAVLLMDDGTHGWTLPAISVRQSDWAARGREVVESLTDRAVRLDRVERVRRIDYHEREGDGHVTVHHVVVRADPVAGEPAAAEPTVGCDGSADVGWFDTLPEELTGTVAADARLFF